MAKLLSSELSTSIVGYRSWLDNFAHPFDALVKSGEGISPFGLRN
jgi:hypothetical protein